MRSWLAISLLGTLLAQGGDPCADCSDRTRPWMRGTTEKSCARPEAVEAARTANPNRLILACACKHACDPNDPLAGTTGGRTWDALCEARCNPSNCACPHPCTMDP